MITIVCRPIATAEELAQCLAIRHRVFVLEQQLFAHSDQDEHDTAALHLAAFSGDRIIGTVRLYQDSDETWWGGRLAVLKRYRGRAGRELVMAAMALVRTHQARSFKAHILKENLNFFKSIGWRRIGDEFIYQGRLHYLVEAVFE